MVLKRTGILAVVLLVITFGIYLLSAILLGRVASPSDAYFDALADAFLHGRLYLDHPLAQGDLTLYAGRWYVPFPPLPAVLLLPWVAVFGVAHTNTIIFGALVGAANVVLSFLLLQALAQRGWTQLNRSDNLWLTLLFGMGSVHWYMATQGSVWFLSQLCTACFLLLAAWSAVATGAPLLAGGALAVAMLARPHVALCFPLLLGIRAQQATLRQSWRWALLALLPLLVSVGLLLTYNAARFNNPLDFGYLNENVSDDLARDLHTYGQFSLHYVPHNLWSMLLAGPTWNRVARQIVPDLDGMSVFFTTPALVYLFNIRQRSSLMWGAAMAVSLLLLPLMTYYNTGWWQFGYRFSLDFMTPVLVLLALGAGSRVNWPMRLLIIIGVLVNAWGVWWFQNQYVIPFNQFGS